MKQDNSVYCHRLRKENGKYYLLINLGFKNILKNKLKKGGGDTTKSSLICHCFYMQANPSLIQLIWLVGVFLTDIFLELTLFWHWHMSGHIVRLIEMAKNQSYLSSCTKQFHCHEVIQAWIGKGTELTCTWKLLSRKFTKMSQLCCISNRLQSYVPATRTVTFVCQVVYL